MSTDQNDGPIFKVVANRGVTNAFGTEVYVFGRKLTLLEAFSHATEFRAGTDTPLTRIEMTIAGTQVEQVFRDIAIEAQGGSQKSEADGG